MKVPELLDSEGKMNKMEFLEQLRKEGQVKFGDDVLAARPSVAAQALHKCLAEILQSEETVLHGIQTSSFGEEWAGALSWLLVLSRHLLEVILKVEAEPVGKQERQVFHVTSNAYRKDRLNASIDVKYPEGLAGGFGVQSAKIHISLDDGARVIKVESSQELKPQALYRFLRSLG